MTSVSPQPIVNLVPETAPFSDEQRAWLNGFFAGLVSLDGAGVTALSPDQNAALMPQSGDGDDGEAPWHDPALPITERMKLAEGRPLRRRMMAVTAQQDCGQCGYNCNDYADKIFDRSEERLNLCVPGGKETTRMLKQLYEEIGNAPAAAKVPATAAPASGKPATEAGRSRDNPAVARFVSRYRLNKSGSEKETYHLDFDLREAQLDYTVGDAFGLFPRNDPVLVEAIVAALGLKSDFEIAGRALRDVLIEDVSLSPAPDSLFQLFSYISGGERRQKAKALASGEDPDGDAATLDVLATLEKFAGVRPDVEAFIESLEPLQPRLYSISSSPKVEPDRLSLTVDAVRYRVGARLRKGVASNYLTERVAPGDPIKVYVQKAHAFGLPADPSVPVIMVGPGTGVAPFRAFLHERMAIRASGPNWLFFGHQKRDHDFFYEDELNGLKANGVLTRLSLAWSRDGDHKFYVQDRMREVGRDLWSWLADGAHFYVCGDAQRMAKDVERALVDIVAQYGARTTDEAVAFLAELKKNGRYQQDVY